MREVEPLQQNLTYCVNVLFLSTLTRTVKLLDSLNWVNVWELFSTMRCCLIIMVVKGRTPKYLSSKIRVNSADRIRTLKNVCDMKLTTAVKATSQNALFDSGKKKYNSLLKVVITGGAAFFKFEKM